MLRARLDDVPWLEWKSPSGHFHGFGRQISEALGAVPNAHLGAGGHPFDLEFGRLPARKPGAPFHSHSAQWELFYVVSGTGEVRYGQHRRAVQAGDAVLHPPGEPHQLINTGEVDLTYFLIADNPLTEFWHYPDSHKWGHRPGGATFRRQPVDFWHDEEPAATSQASPAFDGVGEQTPDTQPGLPTEPLARFVSVDALPWEVQSSPTGRFHSQCRNISLALGATRNLAPEKGGHPFDLQIRRVAPGAAICPFHLHMAQWELFVFTRGHGFVRSGTERHEVSAGDIVLHPPQIPHQTMAAPETELECVIIANNPLVDVFHYPDSDKWGMRPPGKFFRLTEVPYFDGEE
jgi:uncharacterized cupin superfamily protein